MVVATRGQISVQDLRTREIKDIMEYPSVNEGVAPKIKIPLQLELTLDQFSA